MEKRILGKSGFNVSLIGLGGIPIQNKDQRTSDLVIQECYKNGVNFIDTARGYEKSEELIGKSLQKVGREHFILATKSTSRDYQGMKVDIEISLNNLKTDYIDLYQCHFVKDKAQLDKIFSEDGAYKALTEAKNLGKIKAIGVSAHNVEVADIAIQTGKFDTIQFPYNPVERQAEKLFEKAKNLNIGVIVMKPSAGGAIRNVEYSLRYIAENPNISVIIPGMESANQVIENASVGKYRRALNEQERKDIINESKELGSEFCRRCGYCTPCPQGIDIPVQFIVEGYYSRYDLKEWAVNRYNNLSHNALECIECGQCESKCPYNLPIRKMLKRVAEVMSLGK